MSSVFQSVESSPKTGVELPPVSLAADQLDNVEALERLESLQAAFTFFNQTSSQLAASYRRLEDRVAKLSRELQQANVEKVRAQRKKNQLENRMQTLMEFLPGGVLVLDSKGVVVESNPAAKSLLKEELEGKLWRDIISECFSPKNDDGLEVSTRSGRRISVATEGLDTEGQIILLTDQTETRQLQKSLYRQEKLTAMGKMVSALAHQIRTPLSAALLYAGHLDKKGLDERQRRIFSRKVLGRLQHMESQIRDMMLFVRSELPLNDVIATADLELGLREAMDAPLLIGKSHCEWENHCPEKFIRCNREALISAMMNLVNNALQASEGASRLQIKIDEIEVAGESKIRFTLRDHGQGMSPELMEKVNELFVTTKPQGTGLGLAVVLSVARAHGGEFRLESEPGKGTDAILILAMVSACRQ